MRRWLSAAALVLVAGACSTELNSPTGPAEAEPSLAVSADQAKGYIVVFQDNTVNSRAVSASLARQVGVRERYVYEMAIQGFAADLSDAQVQRLQRDPRVKLIEPDGVMSIQATQSPTPSWGLDRIDQQNLPLNNSYTYTRTGAGVTLYTIDTGILYTHNDFGGRATPGFDAVTPGGGAVDCHGHGTHVSSTAAGTTYGVAKGMSIVGVRVLNCGGSGTTSGVIAGVDWVRTNATLPAVANMSLGGGASSTLDAAVNNAIAAGITFAIAAGNSNLNACNFSPARVTNALTVGATTQTDARSSFSNFGTCLDIFAPGSLITAAWIGSNSATNTINGTSMATPHVAGVAGQYLEQNPAATPAQVATAITTNAAMNKVTNPGTGSPNRLLNMQWLNSAPPGNPPVSVPNVSCTNMTCTFDGTGSTDDVGIVSYEWLTEGGAVASTQAQWTTTFAVAKTRTWSLRVTDGGGLSDTQAFTFTVPASGGSNQPPVSVPTVNCVAGGVCNFDGSGSTDDAGIVAYEWRTEGGAVASTQAVWAATFKVHKTRTWTLTVTDGGGLSDTKPVTFTSHP
jgi:subtilisin family serine protease